MSVSSLVNFAVGALVLPNDLKMSDVSFLSPGFFSIGFFSAGFGSVVGFGSAFGAAVVLDVDFSGALAGLVSAFVGSVLAVLLFGGSMTAGGGGGRRPVRRWEDEVSMYRILVVRRGL